MSLSTYCKGLLYSIVKVIVQYFITILYLLQALWQEGNTNVDPRVSEMMAMQEELRQKKNALEALMKRMGKSSSFNMDNISDNISDNVSDTSDRLEGGPGTAATWGTAGAYSENHYHHSRYSFFGIICFE